MNDKPVYCKVYTFVLHTGSVVVDKRIAKYGNERVIAETSLDYPLADVNAFYMAFLPFFNNIELDKTFAFELTTANCIERVNYIKQGVCFVSLSAGFPAYTFSAVFICCVQMFKSEHLVVIPVYQFGCGLALFALRLPALITCFTSFVAVHKN